MPAPKVPFRLSPRLQAVASLVCRGGTLADIGADHGYLVTWLAAQDVVERGLACDINPLPLEHSRSTILLSGMEDKIEVRLSDGLKALAPGEFSQAVIAGMGGDTIAEILGGVPWSTEVPARYILQPNSKENHLREWLYFHGFRILEEHAVKDGKYVYPILVAEPGRMELAKEQLPVFYAIGMIGENCIIRPQEEEYLLIRKKAYSLRLNGKKASSSESSRQGIAELERVVTAIDRRLQGLEGEHLKLVQANSITREEAEDYREEHLHFGEEPLHVSAMLDSLPFDDWLRQTLDNSRPETGRPNRVQESTFFAVRRTDNRVVGMLDIRHQMNHFLQLYMGNIGYGVRPTERNKGYALEILRLGLKYSRYLGLNQVKVSCFQGNDASKQAILNCGGVLEREFYHTNGKMIQMYWIDIKKEDSL